MDHQFTFSSTAVENIPRVKRPNKGPPTTPNIVKEACRTPPRYSAKKAMARLVAPKATATSWVIQVKRASGVFLKNAGCKYPKQFQFSWNRPSQNIRGDPRLPNLSEGILRMRPVLYSQWGSPAWWRPPKSSAPSWPYSRNRWRFRRWTIPPHLVNGP